MIRSIVFASAFMFLVGCAQKEQIVITKQVAVTAPESLMVACKVEPVRLDYQTYETAFYAARDAYIATAKNVAKCNARMEQLRAFNREEAERINANNSTKR